MAIRRKLGVAASLAVVIAAVGIIASILNFFRPRTIDIPPATIDRITITGEAGKRLTSITDAARIAKFEAFIHTHTSGWRQPVDTFPAPLYTLSFEKGGNFSYVIWIGRAGTNWIGFGGVTSQNNVLRDLTEPERAELLRDLNLE